MLLFSLGELIQILSGEKILIDDDTQTTINITRDEAEIENQNWNDNVFKIILISNNYDDSLFILILILICW